MRSQSNDIASRETSSRWNCVHWHLSSTEENTDPFDLHRWWIISALNLVESLSRLIHRSINMSPNRDDRSRSNFSANTADSFSERWSIRARRKQSDLLSASPKSSSWFHCLALSRSRWQRLWKIYAHSRSFRQVIPIDCLAHSKRKRHSRHSFSFRDLLKIPEIERDFTRCRIYFDSDYTYQDTFTVRRLRTVVLLFDVEF